MKRLTQVLAILAAGCFLVGCMVDEPTGSRGAPPEPVVGLQMSDTLGAPVPSLTVSGTWAIRQVNKNGDVFRGTISLVQIGRLLIGHADWANHPDGHLLGYITQDKVVFGQGFTDTSKVNLVGLYTARAAVGGDTLVDGLTFSSEGDSGTWVATRIAHCPAVQLTPAPLPCQQVVDTISHLVDSTPVPDPLPVPDSTLFPAGCWAVSQTNTNGSSYRGTFYLNVEGDTVTGTALWTGHPSATVRGTVSTLVSAALSVPPPPPTYGVSLVFSYTGDKAGLKGHYEGTLRANGTLSGSGYATEGDVANGDIATWTATRTPCPPAP